MWCSLRLASTSDLHVHEILMNRLEPKSDDYFSFVLTIVGNGLTELDGRIV